MNIVTIDDSKIQTVEPAGQEWQLCTPGQDIVDYVNITTHHGKTLILVDIHKATDNEGMTRLYYTPVKVSSLNLYRQGER